MGCVTSEQQDRVDHRLPTSSLPANKEGQSSGSSPSLSHKQRGRPLMSDREEREVRSILEDMPNSLSLSVGSRRSRKTHQ